MNADVLGDVLSLGFLRDATYRQHEVRAPWRSVVKASHRAMLYLVARGEVHLELDGPPLVLEAGHVAFLPRGAAHTLRCAGRATIVTAVFERDRKPPPLLDRPMDVVTLSREGSAGALVSGAIEVIVAELENPGPASALLLRRLADVIVVQAMRALARQPACRASWRPGLTALSDPPIHEALALMHAQVGHAWTVSELAARVGLSRSGFAARFRELVGEPPLQYLARWRMTRAADLLRETADAVSAIAARVGYDSTPSFNKAFKRWQRTSPGEYRRTAA